MSKEEFLKLLDKYLAGEASFYEKELLFKIFESFQNKQEPDESETGDSYTTEMEMFEKFKQTINPLQAQSSHKIEYLPLWRFIVAATVLIPLAFGIYFLFRPGKTAKFYSKTVLKNNFKAGGNKACLILANGKMVYLNHAGIGLLTQQGKNQVIKKSNGQIVYSQNNTVAPLADFGGFNKIIVPVSGQYKVTLPDGTNVWINSSSSLEYPIQFSGNTREVKLSGEAYFEVAKNKNMSFVVNVNNKMNVKVLGTHFNIAAYDNDDNIATTLLEGTVKIEGFKNDAYNTFLKPGQQAVMLNSTGNIRVSEVDTDEAVAWQQGQFLFNNEDIHSIMRKLSRWYDVDVIYAKDMKNKRFDGSISKYKNISAVLKVMELTKSVHFEFQGRRIIVMP